MKKSSMYVGLDVHKSSIEVAIADSGRRNEVRSYGRIDGSLAALEKVIRKLESKGGALSFVYEAGPCGYEIYRHLSNKGYDCIVVAPAWCFSDCVNDDHCRAWRLDPFCSSR